MASNRPGEMQPRPRFLRGAYPCVSMASNRPGEMQLAMADLRRGSESFNGLKSAG